MKRVLLMVCSICLVLACLFGLFACVAGMKDVMNIKEYKQYDTDQALEGVATARDGIKQLQENKDVYLNGVGTYEAGLIELSSGKSTLNAAYKEYYAGKKTLEDAKKAYAKGVKTLEAGKKEYEAGKQKIADNTQAYNEGKEKLAKIEPLMPYLNQYVEFRDGTIAKLPGFDNAQAWFVKTVRPIAAKLGITIPDDVTDFPAFMNKMVAEGKAQLKEYEDGVAKLAEAEKTIAAGEAKLADAEKQIAAGEKKLADAEKQLAAGEKKLAAGKNEIANGDKKLKVYEGGQEQLAAGMQHLLDEMVPCTTRSGKQTVPSLKELLGDDFSIWVLNDKGEVKVERGCQFVDLDACAKLCDEAVHYVELQTVDVKRELYPRIAMNIMMALAAVIGIVASIVAIVGAVTGSKKTGFVGGIITAILLSAFALAISTGGQYPPLTIPAVAFKDACDEMDIHRCVLSRSMEDVGTLLCAIMPWGIATAFYSSSLGVAPLDYIPFTFLPMLSIVIAFINAWVGFGVFRKNDTIKYRPFWRRPKSTNA